MKHIGQNGAKIDQRMQPRRNAMNARKRCGRGLDREFECSLQTQRGKVLIRT